MAETPQRNPRGVSWVAVSCLLLGLGACAAPMHQELPSSTLKFTDSGSAEKVTSLSSPPPSSKPAVAVAAAPASLGSTLVVRDGVTPSRYEAPVAGASQPGAVVRTSAEIPQAAPLPPPKPAALPDLDATREMTVEESLQYAVEHHPLLRARREEIQVAQGKLITAGTLVNPKFTVDYDVPVDRNEGSQITSTLVFTLPTANKISLAKAVAEANICRARCVLNQETLTVRQQVGDAAVDVLYLQELLAVLERLSVMAAKQAEVQEARFAAAQAPFADAMQAEVLAKDIELRRLNTSLQLDTAGLTLARTMGLLAPNRIKLRGQLVISPLPAVPVQWVLAMAEKNAPSVAAAQAMVLASQRQLGLAQAKAVPDLELGPRWRVAPGNLSEEGNGALGAPQDGHDRLGGRFGVDLPLFDRNQGGIYGSAAQIKVDGALLDNVKLTTLGDAAAAYEELRSLKSRMHYYETQVIALADKTEAAMRTEDVTRAIPPLQLATMMEEFLRIRVTYVEFRYRYETLYRHLEQFIGCRLVDLQDPSSSSAAVRPEAIPAPPPSRPR